MIMNMIAVGMSADDRLKVLAENALHPFRSDFVCQFRVTFSSLERLNYMKRFDRGFPIFGYWSIETFVRIMIVSEPKFLLCNRYILGAIQTCYI